MTEDQMLLGPENVEQAEAHRAAETDESSEDREARAHKRRINLERCRQQRSEAANSSRCLTGECSIELGQATTMQIVQPDLQDFAN
jgi:hypothetical protein